jgi:gas vesicle protein
MVMRVGFVLQYDVMQDNMHKNLEAIRGLVKQADAMRELIKTMTQNTDRTTEQLSTELSEILKGIEESIDTLLTEAERMKAKAREFVLSSTENGGQE